MDPIISSIMHGDVSFSIEPRKWDENGTFPKTITVITFVLGTKLDYTLNILDGLSQTASLSSKVLLKNDLNSEISELESANLVFK